MKKLTLFVVILLLFTFVLAACRQAPAAEVPAVEEPAAEAPAEEPAVEEAEAPAEEAPVEELAVEEAPMDHGSITIAFMGPLTGGAAFIGEEMLGFAKVTAEIFTSETGIEVTIMENDDEINPDTGRIVAERLAADDSVIGVVGPAGSQVCESVMPVFEEAGLAYITPSCTRTDLTQPGSPVFFRPIPTDADQSATDAAYMVDVLGITSAFLVDDQSSYSVGLNDEMEVALNGMGVTDIQRVSVTQEETDFSSVVTAVLSANSDLVFFPSQITAQIATLAVQLREQAYGGIYFLADGGFSPDWVATAGAAAEGTYVSFFAPDPNLVPSMADYNAAYTAQYSDAFGAFGGATAMATQVMLEAAGRCAEAGTATRECVVAELGNTDIASSILGVPVKFGEGNQAAGNFSLFQVQDGGFALLAGDEAGMAMEASTLSYDGVIKIAFAGPLTGGAAFVGEEQLGFVQVAVDLFNERTGLNVVVEAGDDEMNPDTGRILAERQVADDEIFVVIGPAGSQVCEATQPVFEAAGLAHLTQSCTRTTLTDPGTSTFFRPIPTDADQSATIADHMLNTLGVTSIYMVDDQSSYAIGLSDELEALLADGGVADIQRASVTQEETDFSSLVTAVIATNPDVVFFPTQIEAHISTMAIQLREQGYEGIYYLPDGGFATGWVEAAGAASEGAYVTFFAPDPNLVPTMAPYNERYAAEYSETFGAFGGAAAFTAYIALDAIETCVAAGDVSRACIVDALGNMDLATTPLGLPVRFNDNNQNEFGAFSLFQIKDGAFTLLSEN